MKQICEISVKIVIHFKLRRIGVAEQHAAGADEHINKKRNGTVRFFTTDTVFKLITVFHGF